MSPDDETTSDPIGSALRELAADAPAAPGLAATLRRIRRRRARVAAVSVGTGAAAVLAASLALPALLPGLPGGVEDASTLSGLSAGTPEADEGSQLRQGVDDGAALGGCPAPDAAQERSAASRALRIDGLDRVGADHPDGSIAVELRLAAGAAPQPFSQLRLWLLDGDRLVWQGVSPQDAAVGGGRLAASATAVIVEPSLHCLDAAASDRYPSGEPFPGPGRYRVIAAVTVQSDGAAEHADAELRAEGELFLP